MCEPTTIALASLALGGAQAVTGYMGAQASAAVQQEAYEQNAINVSRATATNYRNLNIRTQQEGQAAAQAKQQNEIDRARAVSAAGVAAAEGGVSGLAVDGILRDIYAQAGRNDATIDTNLRMSRDYLQGELEGAEISGQSAINGMAAPEAVSALPYALGAFSSGINAYSTKLQLES